MKSFLFTFLIAVFLYTSAFAQDTEKAASYNKFLYYKNKYRVNCADEKITDNFGNGYGPLYGTRNMRTILFGVAYRGGANNFYHRTNKRNNHNPLPEDGLNNLLQQGFSTAIYLYATNFADTKKLFVNKHRDTLVYLQNSGMNRKTLKDIMLLVKSVIDTSDKGPVYLHCWNGWHQSGYISAAILMQFCGITNQQAYDYWIDNADGINKGFDNVKSLIKNFVPYEDIQISHELQREICPCLKKK